MKSIALKLTNKCNMRCEHCYDTISHNLPCDMSDEILDKSINFIIKIADSNSDEIVSVVFIGGEVLLAGIDKLNYVLDRLSPYRNIVSSLDTNLAYDLTDEHINLFKRFRTPSINQPTITTSWDYKIRFKNEKDEVRFFKNIDILNSNSIRVSLSITLTKLLIDDVSVNHIIKLFKEYNILSATFNRLFTIGNATDKQYLLPSNREVDKWLSDLIDNIDKLDTIIDDISELIYHIKHKTSIKRCNNLCGEMVINTNGKLTFLKNNLDVFYGDVDGNINMELYLKNYKCSNVFNDECIICKYYNKYCNGVCGLYKFDSSGCPGIKNTITKIEEIYG